MVGAGIRLGNIKGEWEGREGEGIQGQGKARRRGRITTMGKGEGGRGRAGMQDICSSLGRHGQKQEKTRAPAWSVFMDLHICPRHVSVLPGHGWGCRKGVVRQGVHVHCRYCCPSMLGKVCGKGMLFMPRQGRQWGRPHKGQAGKAGKAVGRYRHGLAPNKTR